MKPTFRWNRKIKAFYIRLIIGVLSLGVGTLSFVPNAHAAYTSHVLFYNISSGAGAVAHRGSDNTIITDRFLGAVFGRGWSSITDI